MIQLIYITNNVLEAQIVDRLDIDWIFIDLEVIGKKERQIGRNTVLSKHSFFVDIYKLTARENGVNNNLYMCDETHLSPKCLSILFEKNLLKPDF